MKKGLLMIAVLAVVLVFLFGCTAQQKSQNSSLDTSETLKQQQQYEDQINSMTSELNDMNSFVNDPELDMINFVQLDENAFK